MSFCVSAGRGTLTNACVRSSVGAVISPYIDDLYDYTHPFRVEHMHHVLNILLPHVRRFRSLAILTDRWAPMHTALDCLSMEMPSFVSAPQPLPSSLPLLETLVLMRCNEFVSYHAEFSPTDRKDPAYLPFSALLPIGAPEDDELVLLQAASCWPAYLRELVLTANLSELIRKGTACKLLCQLITRS